MSELTIFEETARRLGRKLEEAAVDHAAFEVGLAGCELTRCRATCCHDGVILGEEEYEILGGLSDAGGFVQREDGAWKTATVEASEGVLAEDFPAHFAKTRCVFLDEEHRCRWQLRAVEEGRHPWFYKPFSCWMHPVLVEEREGRPVLTLKRPEEDEVGFATQTPCGKSEKNAPKAYRSLQSELEMLSGLSGRDFVAELDAPGIDG